MSVPDGTRNLTLRRYGDGDSGHLPWQQQIFTADASGKCPVYVHRTPPCQASCPAGEDIRGWLDIVRGLDKPAGMPWQEHAFRRLTAANPFPAVMGRVCPAPCESTCNRNSVEEHVGINAVEHFIGDWALEHGLRFPRPGRESGRRVAIIGGGPAGLACAYHLRLRGHGCTVFEANPRLGGMMRYGIPGYRTPRAVVDGEIERILEMGVEVRTDCRIGTDVALAELERQFDAIFLGIGAQTGTALAVPGGEAPNCISGISFLRAFNTDALRHVGQRVIVIGGGDTAMDVAAVARRLGYAGEHPHEARAEALGQLEKDVAAVARREGADVIIAYRRAVEKMPAARSEIEAVTREGVRILPCVVPVEVLRRPDGRARALRLVEVEWKPGGMALKAGTEFEIECDLIVSAIGQAGDFTGMERFDNGKGLVSADKLYRVPGENKIYVGGDVIRPHLLTTAVGHARIAAEAIDRQLAHGDPGRRPKIDVCHFNLLAALRGAAPAEPPSRGQTEAGSAGGAELLVQNYEDRSATEIVRAEDLFLAHFQHTPRQRREEVALGPTEIVGNFAERLRGLAEAQARAEAERCMSCGLCMECDNCIIYCPQKAVVKVPRAKAALGRYVDTDYSRCIGCHICKDVCPSGYIQMGLGE